MSLSWRERYVAVLGASGVGLYRRRADDLEWLGDVACIGGWSSALEALGGLLGEQRARADLWVVLSSQYCRFCRVPWCAAITTPAELLEYAGACLESIFGSGEVAWQLSVSAEGEGLPRLAAAIPQELLQRLRELAAERGLRLLSVQPYLMAAYNHFRAHLPGDDFIFLVAEPERSTGLVAQAGQWQRVFSQGCGDSDEELGALLQRQLRLMEEGTQALPLFVHAPGRRQEPRPALDGACRVLAETAPDADWDVRLLMARTVH
ncbi:hypothetical protein [Pseudomonas citronellolis]|uniref:hypothetical protein n=1 Tax=Pseudomonas citronellolis TaxID=53408 RepID=UPI0023E3F337|nr:hypothetical protein [Pseudomonas citronellolis]MDF3935217.1 hypothetical protein [Pseudomonas citronellolis]